MSERDEPAPAEAWRKYRLPLAVIAAAIAGAVISRVLLPNSSSTAPRPVRPIVQIVRPQAGLPDLSDLVSRLCPSVATIVSRGADPNPEQDSASTSPHAAAFAISADGWLVTSAPVAAGASLDAVFGDGHRAAITDVRSDPVSGLTIAKVDQPPAAALTLSDQAFPRVGQFGFALESPAGSGCSANAAMIDSDFLADGGAPVGYVRVGPRPDSWPPGMPFLGTDGRVVGIAAANPDSAIIPAPLAAVVIDELIRNNPPPSTRFGFRAVDFSPPLSTRLGDVRSGAGVAFVQPKSSAATAGLRAGDIVTAVNDEPVSSASELNRALDALSGPATLSITRGSQSLTLTIRPS